jgi:hypothetical protein
MQRSLATHFGFWGKDMREMDVIGVHVCSALRGTGLLASAFGAELAHRECQKIINDLIEKRSVGKRKMHLLAGVRCGNLGAIAPPGNLGALAPNGNALPKHQAEAEKHGIKPTPRLAEYEAHGLHHLDDAEKELKQASRKTSVRAQKRPDLRTRAHRPARR